MIQLFKGDCLEVMKSIPDKSIDFILCDLPYELTVCDWDKIIPFDPLWEQYERIIKDNGCIALFGNEPFSSRLRLSNLKLYRYDIKWNKLNHSNPLLANTQPLRIYEDIMIFYKAQPTYNPQMTQGKPYKRVCGGYVKHNNATLGVTMVGQDNETGLRYPVNIVEFSLSRNNRERLHPTQKPVELLEYLIKTYTNKGDKVLDNCMGSGSTLEACINTDRDGIGIELTDEYFDIAGKRLQRVLKNKGGSLV